ncbi:MAG: DUF1566 domain-containing protein [Betaproteobacteria bacterium]|nr:DUF1566 domain-containing protein [Betaproteobacteria bacterium]
MAKAQPNSGWDFMIHPATTAKVWNACALFMAMLSCCASTQAQQICSSSIPLTRPDSRYEPVFGATPSGSELRDKVTGLIWQRCAIGTVWSTTNSTCTPTPPATTAQKFKWTDALEVARTTPASAAAGGRAWRLPNHAELYSLPERACYGPALNITYFANDPAGWFWSSSPHRGSASMAWIVNTYNGEDYVNNKDYPFFVRLVR